MEKDSVGGLERDTNLHASVRAVVVDSIDVKRVKFIDEVVCLAPQNIPTSDEFAVVSLILTIGEGLVSAIHL